MIELWIWLSLVCALVVIGIYSTLACMTLGALTCAKRIIEKDK